jgi:hypothetical protein
VDASHRAQSLHTRPKNASLPAKAKSYGKNCHDERKTHVAGTPGKAFSRCLTDMAKLERLNQQPANGVQGRKQDARRHARGAVQPPRPR